MGLRVLLILKWEGCKLHWTSQNHLQSGIAYGVYLQNILGTYLNLIPHTKRFTADEILGLVGVMDIPEKFMTVNQHSFEAVEILFLRLLLV